RIKTNSIKPIINRAGTAQINACGDSRLRGRRSRKPIGFRQWVVHNNGTSINVLVIRFCVFLYIPHKIVCQYNLFVLELSLYEKLVKSLIYGKNMYYN
ncbi:MAG: hypothetical protein IIT46_17970, partial [Lachnospiraceae bacterium]|nr:hypothetical protein [Lachnospiraceae bacterium]